MFTKEKQDLLRRTSRAQQPNTRGLTSRKGSIASRVGNIHEPSLHEVRSFTGDCLSRRNFEHKISDIHEVTVNSLSRNSRFFIENHIGTSRSILVMLVNIVHEQKDIPPQGKFTNNNHGRMRFSRITVFQCKKTSRVILMDMP
jgi:hypothetical protein